MITRSKSANNALFIEEKPMEYKYLSTRPYIDKKQPKSYKNALHIFRWKTTMKEEFIKALHDN